MKQFKINDVSLPYAREAFNEAWKNERSVEVSLGRWFLNKFNGNVLEVGAVMPYYGHIEHEIIDLADEHPKSRKINALDFNYDGRNVLSISTLEHMHMKEYSNGSDQDGADCLKKIVARASNYLITFPTEYNRGLIDLLKRSQDIPRLIMKRINWKNEYVKHYNSNDLEIPFGHSDRPIPVGYFNNANGVCVVTNLKELL
jgi:hypothetical protein